MSISKSTRFFIIILFLSLAIYFVIYKYRSHKQRENCISLLAQSEQISMDTSNNSIILSGSTNIDNHETIVQLINKQCQNITIQNSIKIETKLKLAESWLTFKIDHVNNKVSVFGIVNSQDDIDNILSSFSESLPNMSIAYEIDLNKNVNDKDFAVSILLILTAIDEIKLIDISLQKQNLTIKGLARDKLREQQTLMKLNQIFEGEYNIINQLELVINNKPDIEKLKFEKIPLPKL